jgi:hypothetical protein
VLGTPADVVGSLRLATERGEDEFLEELRGLASGYFRHRTQEIERFRRLYVHEAYQAAGLHLLARSRHEKAEECTIILRERFPDFRAESAPAPEGFPPPDEFLGARTFFTELRKYPELRADLWPDESQGDARERFRRREQRRELLSAQARLGVAYIDLYTLAIREVGSFESKPGAEPTERTYGLVVDFVESLEQQRTLRRRSAKPASEGATEIPTFGAYDELHLASENFDTLLAVNFPEVPTADLSELAEIYGRALQNQSPVGTMRSGVNRRVVRQFRMPGFPYILVTTDVLQEGEDLHTFCHRVIHYGITWTPSAMEQRTGRIDRIGSLVQRRLDGRDELPRPEEKIQVHYPYLPETVEVLQVRRVLERGELVHARSDARDPEPAPASETEGGRAEVCVPGRSRLVRGTRVPPERTRTARPGAVGHRPSRSNPSPGRALERSGPEPEHPPTEGGGRREAGRGDRLPRWSSGRCLRPVVEQRANRRAGLDPLSTVPDRAEIPRTERCHAGALHERCRLGRFASPEEVRRTPRDPERPGSCPHLRTQGSESEATPSHH